MCDEYYDERMKAFWRALAEDSDLELDEEKSEETQGPILIDSPELPRAKAKPKAMSR